jgi:hypothetical protein
MQPQPGPWIGYRRRRSGKPGFEQLEAVFGHGTAAKSASLSAK